MLFVDPDLKLELKMNFLGKIPAFKDVLNIFCKGITIFLAHLFRNTRGILSEPQTLFSSTFLRASKTQLLDKSRSLIFNLISKPLLLERD